MEEPVPAVPFGHAAERDAGADQRARPVPGAEREKSAAGAATTASECIDPREVQHALEAPVGGREAMTASLLVRNA